MDDEGGIDEATREKLKELKDSYESEDWDRVRELSTELLKENDNDKEWIPTVQSIQLRAMGHLKQWSDALEAAATSADEENVGVWQDYAKYQLGQYEQLSSLASTSGSSTISKLLAAQAKHQRGENATADYDAILQDMMNSEEKDADADDDDLRLQILINRAACAEVFPCVLRKYEDGDDENNTSKADTNDPDLLYNEGLALILGARYHQGEALLRQALQIIYDYDDTNDNDDDAAQTIHAALRYSRQLQDLFVPPPLKTASTTASDRIAQLNACTTATAAKTAYAALNADGNNSSSKNLSALQRQICDYNRCVWYLKAGDLTAAQDALKRQLGSSSGSSNNSSKKKSATIKGRKYPTKRARQYWTARWTVLRATLHTLQDQDGPAVQVLTQALADDLFAASDNNDNDDDMTNFCRLYLHIHLAQFENRSLRPEDVPTALHQHAAVRAVLHPDSLTLTEQAQMAWAHGDLQGLKQNANMLQQLDPIQQLVVRSTTADDDDDDGWRQEWQAMNLAADANPMILDPAYATPEDWDDQVFSSGTTATDTTTSTSSTRNVRQPKSREAVLRHRARRAERYVASFADRGLPAPPTPHPDRWLSKYDRYRGRNRNNNSSNAKSAQGTASASAAATMERLDVRAAVLQTNTTTTSGSSSTAHIKAVVSRGSRRR